MMKGFMLKVCLVAWLIESVPAAGVRTLNGPGLSSVDFVKPPSVSHNDSRYQDRVAPGVVFTR